MSFILDALKKSETDRQQQGPAEFAGVPTSNGRRSAPRWLWILGVLLTVNLAVLLGLLFRPEVTVTPATSEPEAVENDAFAEQVAEARRNIPLREEPRAAVAEAVPAQPTAAAPVSSPPPTTRAPNRSASSASLPTIHEVLANGSVTLPALHVDIHVFAESPEDRFVFINMNKQVEGSRLAEGPVVEEITTDGVVLNHNGISFVLPRD
jgi:general secretion pathway protein B